MEVPVRVPVERKGIRTIILSAVVVALVAAAVLVAVTIYFVNLGEVAVVVDPLTGTVSTPVIGPAIGFKAPWAYLVQDYAGVEAVDMFYEPPRDYPAVEALTRDGVVSEVDITIRYRIIPEKFDLLVRYYPRLNYEEDFLVSTARQIVREIIANFSMTDLIEKREFVARNVEEALAAKIKGDAIIGQCLNLMGVNLRNIKLPETVVAAINEKMAAQQRALKAEYERQAALIQANATAQAALIQAEGQAKALLTIARAQAESIRLLADETGVPASNVVAYFYYLEALKQLAQSGRATVVVTPSGIVPVLPVPTSGG
ncbi:MAG: prohibitin family protein [Thermofilaceae archaeon]|nr:prohibitin family protein [Thermofilaceae archaeon]